MIHHKRVINFMFAFPGIVHVCCHRCVNKSLVIETVISTQKEKKGDAHAHTHYMV